MAKRVIDVIMIVTTTKHNLFFSNVKCVIILHISFLFLPTEATPVAASNQRSFHLAAAVPRLPSTVQGMSDSPECEVCQAQNAHRPGVRPRCVELKFRYQ